MATKKTPLAAEAETTIDQLPLGGALTDADMFPIEQGPVDARRTVRISGQNIRIACKGDKGDTGATGPQGLKGDTGAQGPQGLPGKDGSDASVPIATRTVAGKVMVGSGLNVDGAGVVSVQNNVLAFNVPVNSLTYKNAIANNEISIKNPDGTQTSFVTKGIVGEAAGGIWVQQFFNYYLGSGSVIDISAALTTYNLDEITVGSYYSQVDIFGVKTDNTLTILWSGQNVNLYKTKYTTSQITWGFKGTIGSSPLQGILIRAQGTYMTDKTAMIGSLTGRLITA